MLGVTQPQSLQLSWQVNQESMSLCPERGHVLCSTTGLTTKIKLRLHNSFYLKSLETKRNRKDLPKYLGRLRFGYFILLR
jgi:hypothetical protein